MTKHLGPIIAWVIVVGIVLYAVRHASDLFDGITFVRQSIESQNLPDVIQGLFK